MKTLVDEKSPALCSIIWGIHFSNTYYNDSELHRTLFIDNEISEDWAIEKLHAIIYGIGFPIICSIGIFGNAFNLILLTRSNMRGIVYAYMKAYSTAAISALIFALTFGRRMVVHKDYGQWMEFGPAFYTAHLELFLGNACLGFCAMMLLLLTIERYVSVCHLGIARPVIGPPYTVTFITALVTFIIYLPSVFRGILVKCELETDGNFVYFRRDNNAFLKTLFYSVYKIILEVMFKIMPSILIAGLNLRIMLVYRKKCQRKREMIIARSRCATDGNPREFNEKRRLFLTLGSTSILFFVCVLPMALLHITITSELLQNFWYQVYRNVTNLLELLNYSTSFYIHIICCEDFKIALKQLTKWPWFNKESRQHGEEAPQPRASTHLALIALPNRPINSTSGVGASMQHSNSNQI